MSKGLEIRGFNTCFRAVVPSLFGTRGRRNRGSGWVRVRVGRMILIRSA